VPLVVTRRNSRAGADRRRGASLPAGRHTDNPASRSGEPPTASTADNRRRSYNATLEIGILTAPAPWHARSGH